MCRNSAHYNRELQCFGSCYHDPERRVNKAVKFVVSKTVRVSVASDDEMQEESDESREQSLADEE